MLESDAPRPFPQTSWTLIHDCQASGGLASLDLLFRKYWGPVHLFVRRHERCDIEEARDLTQAFFLAFLEKDFLAGVDADKGRFRNFVCAALRHFLSDTRRRERARKRRPEGGVLSLAQVDPEGDRLGAGDPSGDPAAHFDEEWRRAVVEAALTALREEARRTDREVMVDLFVEYYLESGAEAPRPTYGDLTDRYGLSYHQIKNGLAWVRGAFAGHLRREIADLVASEDDYRAEARELFGLEP